MERYQLNADLSLVRVVVCSQSARLSSKSPNVEYKDDVMTGFERLSVLNSLNQLSLRRDSVDNGAPVDQPRPLQLILILHNLELP
jgi:hypothetical protein